MKHKWALLPAVLLILSSCAGNPANTAPSVQSTESVTTEMPRTVTPVLHEIGELNTTVYSLDSAAGEEGLSTLEKNARRSYTLTSSELGSVKPYYPRIRKLKDGTFLLTYHTGTYGGTVYCTTSTDCINWSVPVKVFAQQKITVNGTSDNLKYMTPDTCVLSDGRILCVTSYRAEHTYYNDQTQDGVAVKFSSDNGKTWSEEQRVYTGVNWEPSALEAENGEIYLFFSCSAPSIEAHDYDHRSSGVGFVRSTDAGKTWTPLVTEAPFQPQYVMRQYMGIDADGVKRYNDQMPVALRLNNGTVALAVESYNAINKTYRFSISYNTDGFANDVGMEKTGPADRQSNLFPLAGPYLAQFPSGETLLTYHWSNTMRYRIGDASARTFGEEVTVFDKTGMWGSVSVLTSHSAVMTIGTEDYDLLVAEMILNHPINAAYMTPTLVCDTTEWDGNTDAVFVGSESQAQASVRAAYDDDYLYFLVERLDFYLTDTDKILFFIKEGDTGWYQLTLSEQDCRVEYKKSASDSSVSCDAASVGIRTAVLSDGTYNQVDDTDRGVIYEIAFPKSLARNGEVYFRMKLVNRDTKTGKTAQDDSNPRASNTNADGWSVARLKAAE